MGPTDVEFSDAQAKAERRQARLDAAFQAGWAIRLDPVRGEYAASRDLHTARLLDQLLDEIEGAG